MTVTDETRALGLLVRVCVFVFVFEWLVCCALVILRAPRQQPRKNNKPQKIGVPWHRGDGRVADRGQRGDCQPVSAGGRRGGGRRAGGVSAHLLQTPLLLSQPTQYYFTSSSTKPCSSSSSPPAASKGKGKKSARHAGQASRSRAQRTPQRRCNQRSSKDQLKAWTPGRSRSVTVAQPLACCINRRDTKCARSTSNPPPLPLSPKLQHSQHQSRTTSWRTLLCLSTRYRCVCVRLCKCVWRGRHAAAGGGALVSPCVRAG